MDGPDRDQRSVKVSVPGAIAVAVAAAAAGPLASRTPSILPGTLLALFTFGGGLRIRGWHGRIAEPLKGELPRKDREPMREAGPIEAPEESWERERVRRESAGR